MAKVKITGHASGTGVVTVTAPNTSTDRTITLPDSSGTILDTTSGLDATKLSGNLPAISGANLTSVNAVNSGRKNIIINGDMRISQRGSYTSATSVTSGNYYLDRHKTALSVVTATVQHTDVTIGGVSKKALKMVATSSGTGYAAPYQVIELSNIQVGKTYTFSCWIRSNNANTRFRQSGFGGAGASNSPVFTNDGNWEKVSWTLDSTGTTANPSMYLMQYAGAAVTVTSGDYIEFTDFQLELGSVATDFEHRSYGEELALCQRYYQAVEGAGGAYEWDGLYANGAGAGLGINFPFPVEMRASPTLTTLYNDTNNVATQQNSVTKQGVYIGGQCSSDGRTAMKKNSSGYVRFNAEL